MSGNTFRRRRLLQIGGAALATAAAGCTGDLPVVGDDDGGSGPPAYADWVATVDGEAFVGYVQLAELNELDDEDDSDDGEGGDVGDIDDPMLGIPVSGGFLVMLSAGVTLSEFGLGGLVETDDGSNEEEEGGSDGGFESSIDELLLANDALVLLGSVDADEIDDAVTSEPESEFWGTQFEQTDEVQGYTIYEPASNDGMSGLDQSTTIAVGGNAIVHGADRSIVEGAIGAYEDGESRAVDEFDEFRRLLATAGHGQMVLGGYSPSGYEEAADEGGEGGDESEDADYPTLEGSNGVVGSITVGDSGGTADTAIVLEELDDEKRAELESTLGSAAEDDASIDFDGTFVSASATYTEEDLSGVENVDDTEDI